MCVYIIQLIYSNRQIYRPIKLISPFSVKHLFINVLSIVLAIAEFVLLNLNYIAQMNSAHHLCRSINIQYRINTCRTSICNQLYNQIRIGLKGFNRLNRRGEPIRLPFVRVQLLFHLYVSISNVYKWALVFIELVENFIFDFRGRRLDLSKIFESGSSFGGGGVRTDFSAFLYIIRTTTNKIIKVIFNK